MKRPGFSSDRCGLLMLCAALWSCHPSETTDSHSILDCKLGSTELQAGVHVAFTQLSADSNRDQHLSPGEKASVKVFVRNSGRSDLRGLWGSLVSYSPYLQITECSIDSDWGSSSSCGSACSCRDASRSQDLDPGETGKHPMLTIKFKLAANAPLQPVEFPIVFYDEMGNIWEDSFQLAVAPTGADIEVASTQLVGETADHAVLHPGERAKVKVFAKNSGTSRALDLWTALASHGPHVEVEGCMIQSDWGSSSTCGLSCSCQDASNVQNLDPGEIGHYPILVVTFTLAADAPPEPIRFHLDFHDGMGNVWHDSLQLDVMP